MVERSVFPAGAGEWPKTEPADGRLRVIRVFR